VLDLAAIDVATSDFCPLTESTPLLIAGKDRSPDEDAQKVAMRVLSSPHAALSPLLQLDPSMELGPDGWMLSCIWFPYQTYRACWYVSFRTEYGGERAFAFRPQGEGLIRDTVEEVNCFMDASNAAGYCQDSFTSVPPVVSWIVRELPRGELASGTFNDILARIERERLFGTEIVGPLLSVVEELRGRVPEPQYALWKTRLQRCAAAIAIPDPE
jgi:hypothetical protein